jgi:hypothetical protein
VPGPLSGKPEGTTFTAAQVEGRVPPGERRNKTPLYVSGVSNTRKFLEWIREKTASKLLAQMRGETFMLVPEIAEGLPGHYWCPAVPRRGQWGELSLFFSPGGPMHSPTAEERRQARARIRYQEELEALSISVQAVMQLRSKRRNQDPEKDCPLTPHFVVSVARGPDVANVPSLTEICGLRVQVETYVARKGPLQCKRCQSFGHTKRNCIYTRLRCLFH